MPLNSKQQEAVSYLEGPLLVLAGPGTGKTQLLSAKVAYILEHTDANPENILCITFTDSGAKNMRERLGSMIGRAADDVNIYTYHKFGTNILERYQNYAENLERRIDSPVDSVTQFKIIRDIQANLPVDDILKNANIDDLSDTIQNAKSARLTSDDLRKIANRNLEDSQKISEIASEHLMNIVPRSKFDVAVEDVYQPLLSDLADYIDETPITHDIEPIANLLARELSAIIRSEQQEEKPKVTPLSKWKDAHFERTDDGGFRLKDYIANKKLLSLANIMQKYDEKLRYEGWFDFSDMIEEAIKALKKDRGFQLELSEHFQYVLLDEFQDTNPSQFELIKLITDYEKPVIMAVGDDDQAIFEFQGASASNLLDFQQHYQAQHITLTDNYRSTGEILDFSHHIADQIDDSFAKHYNIEKILKSILDETNGQPDTKSKISRHEFRNAQQEYYWLASEIANLIEKGENPDNIAIIAPKHKYVAPLLPYLKDRNINVAYEKKSDLLEDEKIHQIITLARFIHQLASEKQPTHKVLEILSFPFWQVPPIVALRAVAEARQLKKPTLDYLAESKDETLRNIATTIAELVAKSFDTPLELWLNYLIGKLELPDCRYKIPFLDYYEDQSDEVTKIEFYENLAALRDTVMTHLQVKTPHLADLITMLDDYAAADANIVKTVSYRDHEQAVQIMSAHKSKGLEFKYVFLIAVDDWAWGKSKGNNNKFSLPANLSQIRHTGATDDERLRLFFVAITRAKEHLIMTNSIRNFSDKEVARLNYLDEQRDEKADAQVSPYLPDKIIQLHYDDFDGTATLQAMSNAWSSAYQILQPDLETLLKRNLENYRLTATDLTSFIDIVYAGPESIYRRRAMAAPDDPLTAQIAYGNLIHGVFEQVTNQKIDDVAAFDNYRVKATELALTDHEIDELQQKGKQSLEISLREFAPILRHPNAKAEVNLSAEHLMLDGVPITGKIDHINIDPKQKTIEVYDFKTGNYHKENWQSHFTLYKYALQLEFYKLLLNLSPIYRNYKVTAGHILFVSPDADGKVYDKVYAYTPDSQENLKKLAKNIYQLVMSLEFVKNPEINLSADPKRTLKDVKAFVELLGNYKS